MKKLYWIAVIVPLAAALPLQAQHTMPMPGGSAWFGFQVQDESDSYLGVYLDEVDADTVESLQLPEERGTRFAEIVPDSPAEAAGLLAEDVAVEWNGTPIEGALQFKRLVTETPPGRTVDLTVVREGEMEEVSVEIGSRPEIAGGGRTMGRPMNDPSLPRWHPPVQQDPYSSSMFSPGKPRLGVALQPLTPQLGTYFGLGDGESGVLVGTVIEDSLAAEAGLRAGDVITAIDGEPASDVATVQRAVGEAEGLTDVTFLRDRESVQVEIDFVPGEKTEDEILHQEIYPKSAM